jgi:hypothetical protein
MHELETVLFNSRAVWVLALNPTRIAERRIERSGESFAGIAYRWSDLSRFA